MPKTYKPSEKARREILLITRKLFGEYGYDKTTYQMIAEELGISKSSISYHFKTKSWILYSHLEAYMNSVYSAMRASVDGGEFNRFLFHCCAQIIIYREVLTHEKNLSLFYREDIISIMENEKISLIENYYREITSDFKKDFNEEEIHAAAVMNIGATTGMLDGFMKTPQSLDVDRYCYYLVYLVGLLSRLDEATITKNIKLAFAFADSHAFPESVLFE